MYTKFSRGAYMIRLSSVELYCEGDFTKIENFSVALNDIAQTWEIHHRKETEENKSRKELIEQGLYYHRPADELIFLTKAEHSRRHAIAKTGLNHRLTKEERSESAKKAYETRVANGNAEPWNKGIPMSDEQKAKVSASRKGKGTGPRNLSDEERARRAEACRKLPKRQKGEFKHSEESIRKMSEAHKGNKAHCKPITIEGVTYASKKEAAKALGISYIAFVKKYK